jgi:hypothetical protein
LINVAKKNHLKKLGVNATESTIRSVYSGNLSLERSRDENKILLSEGEELVKVKNEIPNREEDELNNPFDKILTYHNSKKSAETGTNAKKSKIPKELDTICEKNEFNYSNSEHRPLRSPTSINSLNNKEKSYNSTNNKFKQSNKGEKINEVFELDADEDKSNNIVKVIKPEENKMDTEKRNKDNIIVKVKKQQSNINSELYVNETEVLINEKTLLTLNKSIF